MARSWANLPADPDWAVEIDRDRLRYEIQELASSISVMTTTERSEPRTMVREVEASGSRYLVRGEILRMDKPGLGPVVLIALERLGSELPTEPEVRKRFGLTRKQASVAMLLAQRKSNTEIAEELFISPHTARHHTERVLTKLGVHARTDVRNALVQN
jgi:DNA-binding CsgD family transcriptional regulator